MLRGLLDILSVLMGVQMCQNYYEGIKVGRVIFSKDLNMKNLSTNGHFVTVDRHAGQ